MSSTGDTCAGPTDAVLPLPPADAADSGNSVGEIDALEGVAGATAAATAGAGAEAAAGGPADANAGSIIANTEPSEILSPNFTRISTILPAILAGISIEALSDSTVIRLCSTTISSPAFTKTSIISTSLKSPMSGTFNSIAAMCVSCCALGLDGHRARTAGCDAILFNRILDNRQLDLALFCKTT